MLVDGAQLVPGMFVDVQDLDVEYLSFSFHKMLAPFGVGVLFAKEHLLDSSLPFLYGGDMVAEGQVFPSRSATTRCRGSSRPAPLTFSARSSRPRRCAC